MILIKKTRIQILHIVVLSLTIATYGKKEDVINPNLQTIITKVENLPAKYRPDDIKKVMTLMMQGKSVFNNISKNKFYSALTLHIQDAKITNIVKNCLEKSADHFWIDIHNNKKVQQAIEQANVKFTREMSKSPEYFMFFRMAYLKSMITKQETLQSIEASYQEAIIALQWFLFAQAIIENDIFTSAIITVPDQNLYLFYFLDGYCELISPRYRFYSAISFHSLWQSDAHTQLTGHWKHKKIFKDIAFGINFKNKEKEIQNALPLNNSNLIFGALDNKLTFVKWQGSEESVLKKPLKLLQSKNKSDNSVNRYDRIPQDIMYQFKSLFRHPLTRHQSNQISRDGISAMLNMLDDNSRPLFINFLQKAKNYNIFDNTIRKGNEIILNPARFKDFTNVAKS